MKSKKRDGNKRYIFVVGTIVIIWIGVIVFLAIYSLGMEKVYATSNVPEQVAKKSQRDVVNVENILEENTKENIREEKVTEEIDLEYTTIYEETAELAKGKMQVVQEGKDGRQTVVITKTYQEDVLIKEEQSEGMITQPSVNKIVKIGTGNYKDNYTPKKGDILYVAADTMEVRMEANKESDKLITLTKNKAVTFIKKQENWYQIQYGSYTGWADSGCLTNKQEVKENSTTTGGISKDQALASLSENMDLRKPSGLCLEQFKKVLSGISEDKNAIFETNAEYFYYIEKQYNINGIFVAAVGIHESNWGTSKIATSKKNLFGYGASDSNPYGNAYTFQNYSEGIDLIARVFVKYYLNPAGTKIYDGETASGKYYTGNTLAAVNKKYASDKNWHNSVYQWMCYLYNRL